MKASIPLILTGSLAVIGMSVYNLSSDAILQTNTALSTVKVSDIGQITLSEGGGSANDLAIVLKEFSALKSELATLNPTIQHLNLEVGDLKIKLAALSNQLHGKNDDTTYGTTNEYGDQSSAGPDIDADMSAINEEQQKKDDERIDVINNAFQTQDTDEQWSSGVTDSITAVFSDKGFTNTALSQVQCRSTLCIVEVEHSDSSAAEEFTMHFQEQLGNQLPQTSYASSQNDDGSVTVTMYMARDGYEFPQVEQQ